MEFAGDVDASQMEEAYTELQGITPKQRKGFRLFTDLTEVRSVSQDVKEPLKRVMDFLNERGVKEILRVIPDPEQDIGLNIMSIFHYSKDVQIVTLQSRKEALERLDTARRE